MSNIVVPAVVGAATMIGKRVMRKLKKNRKAKLQKSNGNGKQTTLPNVGYQMSRPLAVTYPVDPSDNSVYSLSPTDLEYISVVTDPFNQAQGGSFMAREARIPDSYSGLSLSLVLYAKTTFSGATSTHVHVRAVVPTTASVIGETVYAANELDATATANVGQSIATCSAISNTLMASPNQARVVFSGIRITPLSAAVDTAGVAFYGRGNRTCRTAAGVYSTNLFLKSMLMGSTHTIFSGITARGSNEDPVNPFAPIWADTYDALGYFTSGSYLTPYVYVSGMSATTVLQLEYVCGVEVQASPLAVPFSITPSPFSPDYAVLQRIVDSAPFSVSCNSFEDNVKKLAKYGRKVGQFLRVSRGVISDIASVLAHTQ